MRKEFAAGIGIAAILIASATLGAFPNVNNIGQFASACASILDAEFTNSGQPAGRGSTCVWQDEATETVYNNVSNSEEGNAIWTITRTQTTVYTATFDIPTPGGGPVVYEDTQVGDWVVTSCLNPGGQPFDVNHQHCQVS